MAGEDSPYDTEFYVRLITSLLLFVFSCLIFLGYAGARKIIPEFWPAKQIFSSIIISLSNQMGTYGAVMGLLVLSSIFFINGLIILAVYLNDMLKKRRIE